MIILKIELQNINSLKSDSPILIDFQSKQFIDTNLFAITGPTGAGKTTILDAITIALYRKVHRLKGDNLINVVSRGATTAMCSVTFENEGLEYTASWNIRLASKTGKLLTSPQEKVELAKEGKIITTRVSAFEKEIKSIIKLDFNQFLKSMILAQGDFDAFLSSKENERSEVLKQITGNDVFEKVGEGVLKKINAEKSKLQDLQRGINYEDLLSPEIRKALEQKLKVLPEELLAIENTLTKVEKGLTYYQKLQQTDKEKSEITFLSEELNLMEVSCSSSLEQLKKHDLASPFVDLLRQKTLHQKDKKTNETRLGELTKENELLKKEKVEKEELFSQKNSLLEKVTKEVEQWRKTYKKVSELQLKIQAKVDAINGEEDRLKSDQDRAKLASERIDHLNKGLTDLEKIIHENEIKIEEQKYLENYIPLLPKLEAELKNYHQYADTIGIERSEIDLKKKEKEEKSEELIKVQSNLESEENKLIPLKEELEKITLKIGDQSLIDLTNQKTTLVERINKYSQVISLKNEVIDFENATKEGQKFKSEKEEELKIVSKSLHELQTDIRQQEERVKDAFTILTLKQKVVNFEEERKHLVADEECPLCGSRSHPFVEHYDDLNSFNKEEKEYQERNQKLQDLKEKESTIDRNKSLLLQTIESAQIRLKELSSKIEEKNKDIEAFGLNVLSMKVEEVEEGHQKLKKQQDQLEGSITQLNSLTIDKDQKTELIKEKEELLNSIKLDLEKRVGEVKVLDQLIDENTKRLKINEEQQQKVLEYLVQELGNKKTENIEEVEKEIEIKTLDVTQYQKLKEDHTSNKQQQEKDQLQLKEITDNLDTLKESVLDKQATIKKTKAEKALLEEEKRILIDDEIEVEEYNLLQEGKLEKLQKAFDLIRQEKEAVNNNVLQLETSLREVELALKKLNGSLKEVDANLLDLLEQSSFTNLEEVIESTLEYEKEQTIRKKKEDLLRRKTSLETKKEHYEAQLKELNLLKEEVTEEEEVLEVRKVELQEERDFLLTERGKIQTQIEKDKALHMRNRDLVQKIESQESICQKWSDLLRLLGGTKDSFNKFVQHLTLKNLIILANIHLEKINERYTLELNEIDFYTNKSGENAIRHYLDFSIIDHHQAGLVRKTSTASGGEKFMISLSLALGLSDLSSRNVKIESLFIDEGFGTLDDKALDDVLGALESLQTEGKRIGIISHVGSLNNRIPAQIQVNKQGKGISKVDIVNIK